MTISSLDAISGLSQSLAATQNRQNLPGSANASGASFASTLGAVSVSGFAPTDYSSTRVGTANNSTLNTLNQMKNYYKASPAQRMEDQWLSRHNLTQQQFNAMPLAQQQKLNAEMKQDIEAKVKQKMEAPLTN